MQKGTDSRQAAVDIVEANTEREKTKSPDLLTGKGAPCKRALLEISDFAIPEQYVPERMLQLPLYRKLNGRSIREFLGTCGVTPSDDNYEEERERVVQQIIWDRCCVDFLFWCVLFVYIKPKDGGDDIRFVPRRPQIRLAARFMQMLEDLTPIRIIMLKARQWGGSTLTQVFLCYIQLVLTKGLNSLIVSHEKTSSAEIKDMFTKLMEHYPKWMLYGPGARFQEKDPVTVGSKDTPNITKIPERNSKVKLGTAERPDSARGGDSMLVHCSEVAFWRKTEGKEPSDIVRSACAGALYKPLSVIVYESTARGREGFFYEEYTAAKKRESQFEAFFVPWYEIEFCRLRPDRLRVGGVPFGSELAFAQWLYENRLQKKAPNKKAEPGCYLWGLWEKYGCRLDNIAWYIEERKKYGSHAEMAAENPTDEIEAFSSTSTAVFDEYELAALETMCSEPLHVGEVSGAAVDGPDALRSLRFTEDEQGDLSVWALPDRSVKVANRYLVIVDVGGRSAKADYSDILVLDRYGLLYGDGPEVVAEWHGHIRHDLLAWKAAQIAEFYCHAYLAIESNTLETKDKERDLDGELTEYILDLIGNTYDNLYTRPASPEKIRQGRDTEYGWHTNVSTKPAVIQNLVACVEERAYGEKCREAITEMSYYEKRVDGTYGNVPGEGRHDDRVMVRAIGLYISAFKMEAPRELVTEEEKEIERHVDSVATLI